MSTDPPRLLFDESTPDDLAAAIRAAKERAPTDADLGRVAHSLGLAPLALVPSAPPPPPIAAPAIGAGPIVASVAGVVATVVAGVWISTSSFAPSTPHRQPPAPAPSIVTPAAAPEVEILPAPPVVETPPSLPPRRMRRVPSAAPAPAVEPVAEPAPSDSAARMREEAALVQRASRLLATDPLDALRAANEHRQRFPDGLLGQEREVIAIDALLRLGQRRAAEGRAHAFEAVHAGSVHARRIRQLLETRR